MNRELLGLLKQAGYPDADEPELWLRVVMFNNRGAVPRPAEQDRDYVWRGFHLLMVDPRGRPTHFAKCRSADDPPLEHESRVLETLSADPVLHRILPKSRSACSEVLRVQLSDWLPGITFEQIAPGMAAAVWGEAVRSILQRATLVSERAAALMPDLYESDGMIDPATDAADHLATLRREGVAAEVLDPIAGLLKTAPPLRRQLQHGDLWPGNVLRWDDDWWLLDFEVFGRVQVPLYDVFHLLRSSPGRTANHARWLGPTDTTPAPWARVCRDVLGQFVVDLGLTPAAVGGAYLSYLVEFTARMHSSGAPHGFRAPYLQELRLVSADATAGMALDALVPLSLPIAQVAGSSDR